MKMDVLPRNSADTPTRPSRFRDQRGLSLAARAVVSVLIISGAVALAPAISEKSLYTLTIVAMAAIWATCLNLSVGFTGQLNLSLGAFIALGAYIGGLGTGQWGWNGLTVIAVALTSAFLLSALASLVIFRAKGLQFALLTAGFSLIVYNVLVSWTPVTGGSTGISTGGSFTTGALPRPFDLGLISIDGTRPYFIAIMVFLTGVVLLSTILIRTTEGKGWLAVREDEALSASVGIRVMNRKRSAFILSSVLAALSGVLYAHWLGYITPDFFTFNQTSFNPLAMVVIGGAGTIAGPLLGALVVAGLPEVIRGLADYSVLIYGLALLIVLMTSPGGLMAIGRTGVQRLRSLQKGRRS